MKLKKEGGAEVPDINKYKKTSDQQTSKNFTLVKMIIIDKDKAITFIVLILQNSKNFNTNFNK